MPLKLLEELRAFQVDRKWYEAYWLQPRKQESGRGTANQFERTLAWLDTWSGRIRWLRQVFGAPPPEWLRRGRSALKRSRERARLRERLYGLGDRELEDIGINRGEIEYIVSADQRSVRQSSTESTSIDRPEQCDSSVQQRLAV
jgi:uncharacterized protein YjiS (DUF1127 family)